LAGLNTGKFSTVNDLVLVGDNVFGNTAVVDANLAGSTVYGSRAIQDTVNATAGLLTNTVGAVNIFGSNNFPSILGATGVPMANLIAIGSGIMPDFLGTGSGQQFVNNIFVGNSQFKGASGDTFSLKNNVVIGAGAMQQSGVGSASIQDNVFIGSQIGYGNGFGGGGGSTMNVCIGSQSVKAISGGFTQNVVIGGGSGSAMNGAQNNTIVGYSAGVSGAAIYNTCIGEGAGANGATSYSTLIGANQPTAFTGNGNIVIGCGAGANYPTTSNQFGIEWYDAPNVTMRSMFYGVFSSGNLCIGNLAFGNRDLTTGTNCVKLTNGTKGPANPTGGGYFYVNNGALHWVGTSGTDTVVAVA